MTVHHVFMAGMFRQANLDFAAQGGGDDQAETVAVNGTNKADEITVAPDGAAVDVSNDTTALVGVAVDLGFGQR